MFLLNDREFKEKSEEGEKGAVENMEGGEKLLLREKGPLALIHSND